MFRIAYTRFRKGVHMDQLKEKILNMVTQAGGRIPYRTVYESLDSNEQALLPRAMKSLKADGRAMNQNRRDGTGKLVFEIFTLSSGSGGA